MLEYEFSQTRMFTLMTDSLILFLYSNIRARQNSYSGWFYALHIKYPQQVNKTIFWIETLEIKF